MEQYYEAVQHMYKHRQETIIIGLTGRTGSGCSTVANNILAKSKFEELDIKKPKEYDFKNSDERKQEIIYNYMKADNWSGFHIVEGSAVILSFVFERGFKELEKYLKLIDKKGQCQLDNRDEIIKELKQLEEVFEDSTQFSLLEEDGKPYTDSNNDIYYDYYFHRLSQYKKSVSEILCKHVCYPAESENGKAQLYTYLMQTWGNNIRSSGNPYENTFTDNHFYDVAVRMDSMIDILKHRKGNKKRRVCIDALRTPYEVIYFRDKYRYFYLFSVSTDDQFRRIRLSNLSKNEQETLDLIESPEDFRNVEDQFFHQNINECVQISDIHIYNPNVDDGKFYFLTEQIVKYVALILHPGLVTPSHEERCMQLAYNAKFNSGCLSRQVGAVITGNDFSIRAVGWNDVPKGQVPCNLRSVNGYCMNKDIETFSEFELCDPDFDCAMKRVESALKNVNKGGRTVSYCFKDVYNGYKGTTNQVLTRSLHAEENAFLQLSKYGGAGIQGGFLFTTASPCELCAKKAYQLGIKNIYYIDRYPGISMSHILKFGKENNPKMNLFYGAIGNAYLSLFSPRMSSKDELALLTGISIKEAVKKDDNKDSDRLITSNVRYDSMELALYYNSETDIKSNRKIAITVTGEPINHIVKEITWTGSQYIESKLLNSDNDFKIIDSVRSTSPFEYKIVFNKNIMKDESVQYEVETIVKDEKKQMQPFLSHTVTNPTEKLILTVEIPNDVGENVDFCECRDGHREIVVGVPERISGKKKKNTRVYSKEINNPKLFYTYCLQWKWKDR